MLKASDQHKLRKGPAFLLASVFNFEQKIAVVVRAQYEIVLFEGKGTLQGF